MSDISALSNQYDKLMETSQKVNQSVITYKKSHLLNDVIKKRSHPKLQVSSDDMEIARNILLPFLINLEQILKEGRRESDFIPSLVMDDYRKKLQANQYVKEDLNSLIQILTDGRTISAEEISILDAIMSVLDNERGILFRKLRTARG